MKAILPMLRLARLPIKTVAFALLAMVAAAVMAAVAKPRLQAITDAPSLEATVPSAFGDWKQVVDSHVQVDVSQGVETSFEQPYDQTVMRTYVNGKGERVMLALAWGERQRQDVKVHRPEVCYPAQGYVVTRQQAGAPIVLQGAAEPVPTVSLLAQGRGSVEAVRYWIRIGSSYGGDGLRARWYILNEGLAGRIPDGILVRASQRIRSPEEAANADATMEKFLTELSAAVPPRTRAMLVR
jgi:EpsI family protein